jgi:opacity protein-like surface antigen
MRSYFIRGLLGLLSLVVVPTLHAQASEESDQWQFKISPYLFATSLNGTTGAAGVTTDVDVGFDDLFENIDGAFMFVFEARKGRWGLGFDGMYSKLEGEKSNSFVEPDGNVVSADLDVTMTQQVYQLTLAYRLHDTAKVKFDIFGAGRYTQLDTDLDLEVTGTEVFPGGLHSLSATESWWDPVIGARVIAPFAGDWAFIAYADVGGGGGSSSDSTYQAIAGVTWGFSESLTAKLGYRYLYQDYSDSSNGFVWDMTMEGVYAGLDIAF